jgi:5-methylcytosine-specific restriction endonuclease McrA
MDPNRSLIDRSHLVDGAALAFAAAARAIESGNRRMAIALIVAIDDAPLRAHFYAAADEWRRRHAAAGTAYPQGIEKSERDPGRMPTGLRQMAVYERDRWHCRWCGSPVISLRAVRRMNAEVGPAFPHGGTNDNHHGLTLAAGVSLDHVKPHSLGGSNDEENLIAACWPCQFARGNDSIERLGISNPLDRPPDPSMTGWDGCDWFR